jgi:hypothetical protein
LHTFLNLEFCLDNLDTTFLHTLDPPGPPGKPSGYGTLPPIFVISHGCPFSLSRPLLVDIRADIGPAMFEVKTSHGFKNPILFTGLQKQPHVFPTTDDIVHEFSASCRKAGDIDKNLRIHAILASFLWEA